MNLTGRVMKACAGFYQVSLDGKEISCKARGKLKGCEGDLYVGDLVEVTLTGENEGIIEKTLPRCLVLKRPYIANVDHVFLVFALTNPEPSHLIVDRFLLLMEAAGVSITLIFNKQDLVKPSVVKKWVSYYGEIGYDVIATSALLREGKRKLQSRIANHVSVFTGPSGVGKTALINLVGSWEMLTGDLSKKIERGKHTTRTVQLLSLKNKGYVADTPGFTQLDFSHINCKDLGNYFPEFQKYTNQCRFSGCQHRSEPSCGIRQALDEGEIQKKRYENYLSFWEEINQQERKRF